MNFKPYNSYKYSGIEWIGEIPEHWSAKKLKHVTDIIMGQSPNSSDINNEQKGLLFMQGNADFTDLYPNPSEYCTSPKKISRVNDILMSVRAPVGDLNLSDKRYGIGRGLCSIKAIKINLSYLWYYLIKSKIDFEYYSNGSTFDAVTIGNLLSFPILIPKLKEQKQIVNYLNKETSKIDETIGKNEELITLLKEKRVCLINHVVTKGLNPDVPMKDSGIEWIGEIPDHWEYRKINTLSSVRRGASPRPIDDPIYFDDKGDYSWVRIADVTSSNKYLNKTDEKLSTLGKSLSVPIEPGNIFVSIAATVGKPIIANIKCCIHDGFVYFKNLSLNDEYLFYIFAGGEAYKGLGKLGTQLNLNTETIGRIYVPVPPKHEQKQIIKYLDYEIDKLDNTISKIQENISLLNEYKTSLINHVVTGKVDVRGEKI